MFMERTAEAAMTAAALALGSVIGLPFLLILIAPFI